MWLKYSAQSFICILFSSHNNPKGGIIIIIIKQSGNISLRQQSLMEVK